MRRSTIWLIGAVLLTALTASAANPPAVQWTRTFGGNSTHCFSGQQTSDGGYVLAGWTFSFNDTSGGDVYLAKADSAGNLQWQRTFGSPGTAEEGKFVLQTSDKGYVIAGEADGVVLLLKTDSLGNLRWEKLFATDSPPQYAMCVRQTDDRGYIVSGGRGDGPQWADLYLLRTDSLGDSLWAKAYAEYGEGSSVRVTDNGCYIITGLTGQDYQEDMDERSLYLMKTDAAGSLIWRHVYSAQNADVGSAVLRTQDGGYIVAGEGTSLVSGNYKDILLMKTDSLGNYLWRRTFGGSKWDGARGQCVGQTQDGGYIVGGETQSFERQHGGSYYLVRTDPSGDPLWSKAFDRDCGNDELCLVQQVSDGGYIVGGTWHIPDVRGAEAVLIRLYPDGQR